MSNVTKMKSVLGKAYSRQFRRFLLRSYSFFARNDTQTDRQTDRHTDRSKTIPAALSIDVAQLFNIGKSIAL